MNLSAEGSGTFHLGKFVSSGGFFILTCHAPSEVGWDFSALYRVSIYSGSPILSTITTFGTSYNVSNIDIDVRFESDGLAHVYATKPTYWSYFTFTPLSRDVYADIYASS